MPIYAVMVDRVEIGRYTNLQKARLAAEEAEQDNPKALVEIEEVYRVKVKPPEPEPGPEPEPPELAYHPHAYQQNQVLGSWMKQVYMIRALNTPASFEGTQIPPPEPLPLGDLTSDGPATPEQISLFLPVTNTLALPFTATATCRYRTPGGTWRTGHDLHRVRTDFLRVGHLAVDCFAWPIIDLLPGATYEVEVTVTFPGGGSAVKTLTHTTRSLPLSAGAATHNVNASMTAAQIQTTLNSLTAGNVCQFADGTYNLTSPLSLIRSGTEANPIYIRGQSRTGVVISRTAADLILQVQNAADVVVENLTIQGTGFDSKGGQSFGGTPNSRGIELWSDATSRRRITFRNLTVTGVDVGLYSVINEESILLYNCTFVGNNAWTFDGLNVPADGVTWNDHGINLPGTGNAIFNNTISGFGDSLGLGYSTPTQARGVHFYRNEVRKSGDDFVEFDFALRNCTAYDNRGHNMMVALSLDPLDGGPVLFARNIAINCGRGPYKWQEKQSGQFVYNNTVILTKTKRMVDGNNSAEAAWYQSGGSNNQEGFGYRNNIIVYHGPVNPYSQGFGVDYQVLRLDNGGYNTVDFSYNSWYPDGVFSWRGGSPRFNSLAAAIAGSPTVAPVFGTDTKWHANDTLTVLNPWTTTITLGTDYLSEVTATHTPTLLGGASPKNSGVAIANITDGYSGTNPDRGAVISGRAVPAFGDVVPAYLQGLAVNEWREISSSSMSLNPPSVTQIPALQKDPANIFESWVGFAKDTRSKKIWSLGNGGHSDWYGNEVYVFDAAVDAPHWEEWLPATLYTQAFVDANQPSQPRHYNDSSRLSAQHSYFVLQFIERHNRIVRVSSGSVTGTAQLFATVDGFDCTVAKGVNGTDPEFTYPNLNNAPPPYVYAGSAGVAVCKDPSTECIYVFYGAEVCRKFTPNASTPGGSWANAGGNPPAGFGASGCASAYDTVRNRIFMIKHGAKPSKHFYFDTISGTYTEVTNTISTGPARDVLDLANRGGIGMEYVPTLDAYLIRLGEMSGQDQDPVPGRVLKIDASTWEISLLSTTGGGSVPAAPDVNAGQKKYENIYTRWRYLTFASGAMGVILYFPTYPANAWVLRVH